MEKKYYTPRIEEFHVGFEFERFNCKDWMIGEKTDIWVKEQFDPFLNDHHTIFNMAPGKYIRVKCLDADDIISCGFRAIGSGWYGKDKYRIRPWKGFDVNIYKQHHLSEDHEIIFSGEIKNKSELARILRQVGVIK